MKIGLRIDGDTFRGTRDGVPARCKILSESDVQASFFFSVGPDNMGRHLWRLVRPRFLKKMLRSNAPALYGWDIVLRGTFWPGRIIGKKFNGIIRDTAADGHEIGLHAWDHHAWQVHIDKMPGEMIHADLTQGFDMLSDIPGAQPVCSAVPGWKSTERVLIEKERFPFTYNSDCRGKNIFYPMVDGKTLIQPQVPVTLPTYDEVIDRNGINAENYNDYLLSLIQPDKLNVLTIHAEVEGVVCIGMFKQFIEKARARGYEFTTLGNVLALTSSIPSSTIKKGSVKGREGWVAVQATPNLQGGKL